MVYSWWFSVNFMRKPLRQLETNGIGQNDDIMSKNDILNDIPSRPHKANILEFCLLLSPIYQMWVWLFGFLFFFFLTFFRKTIPNFQLRAAGKHCSMLRQEKTAALECTNYRKSAGECGKACVQNARESIFLHSTTFCFSLSSVWFSFFFSLSLLPQRSSKSRLNCFVQFK